MIRLIVPAGDYWLGDPCYCFDDSWVDLLNESDFFEKSALIQRPNGLVLAFSTAYGDGVYNDQFGNLYGVDAGLLGLVTAGLEDRNPYGGHLIHFDENTECTNDKGNMTFGKYQIKTREE